MTVKTFRDLIAWQKAMLLAQQVYRITAKMPESERFGLMTQMRRAVVSIPSNIAEGHARGSTKEFLRHLSISQGSLAEVETLLTLAEELGYCRPQELTGIVDLCGQLGRMIGGLRKRLRSRLDQ